MQSGWWLTRSELKSIAYAYGFAAKAKARWMGGRFMALETRPLFFPLVDANDPEVFCLEKSEPLQSIPAPEELPIPPEELRLYRHGETAYLETGRRTIQTMKDILAEQRIDLVSAKRILEFGCSNGRLLRWLAELSPRTQLWGCDISAPHIFWAQQHLSPPFHFTMNTTTPHLPFEDRWFDFIFAGSIFTHIDDLYMTWLLELRRILTPAGCLYITIHDENSIAWLDQHPENHFTKQLYEKPQYAEFKKKAFDMFTIGRGVRSQVFYDISFLERILRPHFEILSVTQGAFSHFQTAILLRKPVNDD